MTIALEQLADGSVSDRNFQKLMQAVPDMGTDTTTRQPRSVGIRFGTVTITFTASATSATNTAPHGLGRAPANVQLTGRDPNLDIVVCAARDATNITVQGRYNSVISGTTTLDWIAVG